VAFKECARGICHYTAVVAAETLMKISREGELSARLCSSFVRSLVADLSIGSAVCGSQSDLAYQSPFIGGSFIKRLI